MAGYYCFVDFVLVFQWLWYEHLIDRWGNRRGSLVIIDEEDGDLDGSRTCLLQESKEGLDDGALGKTSLEPVLHSNPRDIFVSSPIADDLVSEDDHDVASSSKGSAIGLPISEDSVPSSSKDQRNGTKESSPSSRKIQRHVQSPSPSSMTAATRTFAYIALIIAISSASSSASPTQRSSLYFESEHAPSIYTTSGVSSTVTIGRIVSWLSTFLYLGSRLPQIVKNFLRRSTAGLSLSLFIAAFFGNLFYASSILANPCAWSSYPPNGARGWVGPEGNDRMDWISRATPFWLGAAGVLMMDAAVGVQFWMYGDGKGVAKPRSGHKKHHHHHHHHHRHHGKTKYLVDDPYVVQPLNSQHSQRSYGSIVDSISISNNSSSVLNKSGIKHTSALDASAAHDGHESDNVTDHITHHLSPPVKDTRRWHRNVSGWMRGWVPGTPLGPGFFRLKKDDEAADADTDTEPTKKKKTGRKERKRKKKVLNTTANSDVCLSSSSSSSSGSFTSSACGSGSASESASEGESESESEYMSVDSGRNKSEIDDK